jgi:hypothetical protein
VELFFSTCHKHGIDINDQIRDAVREKVIAGSQDVINYAQAIKELNLRIVNDENSTKNANKL